jgi:phosphatidylserine/phosphatidylglycerophosphate/cardiolipin synthase-like enzyme
MNWRIGWNAGRGKHVQKPKAKTKAKAKAAPKAIPKAMAKVMAGPVGRPLALRADVLSGAKDWYEQMLVDIAVASEVLMATYMYDHPQLHGLLLRRLKGRAGITVDILIDKGALEGNTPWYQRSRLSVLVNAGATVHVCTGQPPKGIYHRKAVVVDKRYLYTGGANMTYQSDEGGNKELVFRITGQPVLDVLSILDADVRTALRKWEKA